MRKRVVAIGLVLSTLLVVGCGDDSDDGSASQARADCRLLSETWCEQAMTCSVSVGRLPQEEYQANYDGCVRVAVAAVPCDSAVAIEPAFDQCLTEIAAMPCSSWDVPETELDTVLLPDTCNGVVLVQQ